MPWEVTGLVEKRKQFAAEYESGKWTLTDLCPAYGISRVTGYAVLPAEEAISRQIRTVVGTGKGDEHSSRP